MGTVVLWATLLTPGVVDVLILGLTQAGYQVGHASLSQSLTGEHSCLCALRVDSLKVFEGSATDHGTAVDDAKRILTSYCYFSIIAKGEVGSTWAGENFPEIPNATPKAALDRIAEDASILDED